MSSRQGVWAATPQQPPTVIFHLTARFKADSHPKKLNLGVGAYRDDALQPVVFSAVRKAEAAVVAAGYDKEYLPITGLPAFTVRPRARRCCGGGGRERVPPATRLPLLPFSTRRIALCRRRLRGCCLVPTARR
jgi:hypothetical protein